MVENSQEGVDVLAGSNDVRLFTVSVLQLLVFFHSYDDIRIVSID
jgi:hypothetical protein